MKLDPIKLWRDLEGLCSVVQYFYIFIARCAKRIKHPVIWSLQCFCSEKLSFVWINSFPMNYIREGKHHANGRDRTGWINLNFMQQSQMNQSNCMENFCLNYDFLNELIFNKNIFRVHLWLTRSLNTKRDHSMYIH